MSVKDKIINRLLTVKSIVTLALTVVFAVLSLTHYITPEDFKGVFYIVVAFYFGTQFQKAAADGGEG